MAEVPDIRPGRSRWLMGSAIGALLLSADLAAQAAPLRMSVLQRLRDMLGLQRPVAVAGTRSGWFSAAPLNQDAGGLCVLSPWRGDSSQPSMAWTTTGAPPILSREPLAELEIYDGIVLLVRIRAPGKTALAQPLRWPLPPLDPGQTRTLRLRAIGQDRRDVFITLNRSSDQDSLAGDLESLLNSVLGDDPEARRQMQLLLDEACSRSTPSSRPER